MIPLGKLPVPLLARLLAAAGAGSAADAAGGVLVGPAVGEDACALSLPGGAVLVATTDPITLTGDDVGRFAVVVNANDVAVCGVRPRWFLAAVLLPPGTTEDAVAGVFAAMGAALEEVGAVLVGGHTEVTAAVRQPVVVGHMLGVAEDGRFVTTAGARAGDVVVQVGAVPVEGAAVLAAAAGAAGLEPAVVAAAARAARDPGISVVAPAVAAAGLGATAMHDPTEGGLAAGLHELAAAAGVRVRVERGAVPWFDPGVAACRAVGADPWATLASGALLATFPAGAVADAAVEALTAHGRPVAVIGTVEAGRGVEDERGEALTWPERDEVARVLG